MIRSITIFVSALTMIVVAPTDPSVLYVGSQHLWKSTDEGTSWQRISPDLTRADPETMDDSGGPIVMDQDGRPVIAASSCRR